MKLQQSSSFNLLDTKVQQWVWKQGWTSLKDIQENSILPILDDNCDVIISAATAGGKTEAVFLPILTNILKCENDSGYQVLYISPLKSLINDQYRRLQDMTNDMPINVTPWHGDISSTKKQNSLKNPNGILIITPESLEALFVHHHFQLKKAFCNLKYVVIDELHAFIPTERGKQLQSLMSRIEHVTGKHIPRIAMSATFSDYGIVEEFLRQDHCIPCVVPKQGKSSHEIKVLIKEYTYGYNEKHQIDKTIADDLFLRLRGSNNLVFTNNRQECETISILLNEKSDFEKVPNEFRIHHGSISKETRTKVEHELQSGMMPITAICTSTLELGVDIGKVKSIVQIETANSVSSLRQRLGRSGRRDEASILRIYSSDYTGENADLLDLMKSNLFQNIAVIELLMEHKYEIPNVNGIHLSTLIQQVLSVIAQFGSFNPQDGWLLLCKNGAFRNVSPSLFLNLLKDLGNADVIQQTGNGQIIIGTVGEDILLDKEFYAAFTTYPELYIVNSQNGENIGSIMADKIGIGVCVILGGKKWSVSEIDYKAKKAYVIPCNFGVLPIFRNEGADIDKIIVQKMKDIYLSNDVYSYLDKKTDALNCLYSARTYFKKHNLDKDICLYEEEYILLTWAGSKTNRTISLIANLYLDKILGFNHIFIHGLSKEDVLKILKYPKPKAEELCPFLMRFVKDTKKFDYLLSDELLDIEYASMYLDVDAAWWSLCQLVTA
ncbi:MAG: DEAD/DEAH box helicase [Bacteroidaceae bacterium]|nr:DEAD/DEAH box helicase [Bacteroidaceae bacterium]